MSLTQQFVKAVVATAVFAGAISADVSAQTMKRGKGGSEVQGNSQGGTKEIEKCAAPMGSLAIVEPQEFAARTIAQLGLPSPTGLIRLIIQQSNCFQVVERGVAMNNILQERALAGGGQLQRGQWAAVRW